jgi:hypothetical protein
LLLFPTSEDHWIICGLDVTVAALLALGLLNGRKSIIVFLLLLLSI